jgi:hypothetical protein
MREELARDGSLSQFVMQIREQKCIEKILEKAQITDVEPDKIKKPAKKTATKKPAKKAAKETTESDTETDGQAERKKTSAKRTKKKEDE